MALANNADGFFRAAAEGAGAAITCAPGCSSCCHVDLSVSPIEADAIRDALRTLDRAALETAGHARADDDDRCVMLNDDGRCIVYEERPLVCRTQGLALLYPTGFVPADAVRAKSDRGDVTWCPLNYETDTPAAAHILDAGRLDHALAVANRAFTEARGEDPLTRHPLKALLHEALRELEP